MTTTKATAIRYYDVVIVGGGIAGIAIAEFLSRKHSLSIKVLEQALQLGTGASGKLEGWFHAGGLYAGLDDGQTFMNCLNAIEDLITHYTSHFPDRRNLTCAPQYPGLCSPAVVPREDGWFAVSRPAADAYAPEGQAVLFAVGARFERYVQELRVSARLQVSHSAMVVAWPAISTINFARMSIKPKFHFNHLLQRSEGKQGPIQFSMPANSGFLNQDAHVAEKVADIDAILEATERYFGCEALHTRKLYTYECAKAEFLRDEEEKRRYSYWIEHPRDTNYIGVLPGKFSFFPTVAYQTYLRIKELCGLTE